jgi:uncharacterized protein (DUF488 family)
VNDIVSDINVIFTIGHSTHTLDAFVELLHINHVTIVADVRTIPRSRRNPQFNGDTLATDLSASGIAYVHIAGLGGLRRPQADSLNKGWLNATFRGFADYMQTAEFTTNLQVLIEMAHNETVALMCAEAVPWRCHRSLIADALSIRGLTVEHILSKSATRAHVLTPWAQANGSVITYPAQSKQISH